MASPDKTPGGGATLKAVGLMLGRERPFIARPGGYYTDENGEYVPDSRLHPVYRDPVTGEERVGDISL